MGSSRYGAYFLDWIRQDAALSRLKCMDNMIDVHTHDGSHSGEHFGQANTLIR